MMYSTGREGDCEEHVRYLFLLWSALGVNSGQIDHFLLFTSVEYIQVLKEPWGKLVREAFFTRHTLVKIRLYF